MCNITKIQVYSDPFVNDFHIRYISTAKSSYLNSRKKLVAAKSLLFGMRTERAHLESPFCSPAAKMRRVAWWVVPYPRRVRHPAASHNPAEALGPSAVSRSVAVGVRLARTSSRSPKSRPRSCLPVETSFSQSIFTCTRPILFVTISAQKRALKRTICVPIWCTG